MILSLLVAVHFYITSVIKHQKVTFMINQYKTLPWLIEWATQMGQFVILFDNACDKIINDTLRVFFQFAIRWIVLTTSVSTFRGTRI